MLKPYVMQTNTQEEEDKTEEAFGSPRLSTLATDDTYFGIISNYMNDRFGMSEDRYDRQEIVDAYVNNMRSFNAGQSVTTLTEAAHLYKADDAQRSRAGEAYKLWDNTKGAFEEGGTFGERADAVYDYARALIIDPVNLFSLGVGKLVTGGASKVAAKTTQAALQTATKQITEEGIKKGLSEAAIRSKVVGAERKLMNDVLTNKAIQGAPSGAVDAAMRSAVKKEVVGATLFDTTAALGINAAYQSAQQYAGVQSEYDATQAAITGLTGVTGGALMYGLHLLRKGVSENSVSLAYGAIDQAQTARAAARAADAEAGRKATKEALKNIDTKAVVAQLRDSTAAAKEWMARVKSGEAMLDAAGTPVRDVSAQAFNIFLEGVDGVAGINKILEKNNIFYYGGDEYRHFSDWLTKTIKNDLPEDVNKEIEAFYKATIGSEGSSLADKSLNEFMDVFAASSSNFGLFGNGVSRSSKILSKVAGDTPEEKIANAFDATIEPVPSKVREGIANGTMKLQQNLIRMIVTHPGTTALNVIGWVNASGMQSLSDMVRGTLYGTRALGALASGNKMTANQYGNLARNMFALQKQKMVNLVDGFATQQATLDILGANPKLQDKFLRYMAGGIEDEATLRAMGMSLKEATSVDKFIDVFQTAYGVKAVDIYTKTQEFMYAIDKQIRLKYGKSYNEFIADPQLWKALDGKQWAEVQTTAVEDALRNVYSKSYGDSKTTLGGVAKMIEDARKYPVIGAMIPFGQFFNNTIVNMADYSGVSLIHKYVTGSTRDAMELHTRAAVGVTLMGAFAAKEYKNMEAGLAWHEERQRDGQVVSRLYDFPFSFYKAIGRMAAHIHRDGEVPAEMFAEIVETFGPGNLTRQLGDTANLGYRLMLDLVSGEDADVKDVLSQMVGSTVSMYVSGFSRPLDPVNLIAGMAQGEKFEDPDRNDGAKWINNSVRYVDQIFNALDVSIQEYVPEALGGGEKPAAKVSPLSNRPNPVAIGRIFGYRAVPAQTSIETMFNEAGLPDWRTNLKADIPEANNRVNRIIFKFLEVNAANVIDTPKWKESDSKTKVKVIRKMISTAKEQALDVLKGTNVDEDERIALLYDISKRNSGITDKDINEALIKFGYEGDVTDLPLRQLRYIVDYLDMQKREGRAEVEDIARG